MNYIINYSKYNHEFMYIVFSWNYKRHDSLIYALIIFVIIDYATGVLLAIHNRKVSSEIGYKGIIKKVLIFLVVSMAYVIDHYVLETKSTLRTVVIIFYLSNEGFSILENVGQLGLPIPRRLKEFIEKIMKESEWYTFIYIQIIGKIYFF